MASVLQVLGWVGVGFVAAAGLIRLFVPDLLEWSWWLAAAGLGLVAVHTLGQWREVLSFFRRRRTQYGTVAIAGILLAFAVLVAVNYILARQNHRWDLTAGQQYSVSDQTRRVLESLDAPISMLVFARSEEFPRFQQRLDEYAYVSPQVRVDYIDVDRDPVRARQYEIQTYGTVIVDYGGRIERVVSDSEQELTNAIIKAVEGEERTVYFVQGHGERDPTSSERDGYGTVRDALQRDNFGVETVILAQTGAIPDDATVVVIAGPTTDLLDGEIDAVRGYLDRGGKVLLLLDPADTDDAVPQPNLEALAGDWGIALGQDIVVDASGVGQLLGTDATVPVAAAYPPHTITENFNLLTAFPLARSIRPMAGGVSGRVPTIVVETSPRSWAETDRDELAGAEVMLDEEAGDIAGPVPIAVAVAQRVQVEAAGPEPDADDAAADGNGPTANDDAPDEDEDEDEEPPAETRVVVFGDSDFASNGYVGIQGNSDLLLNAVNWLAQQENLIAIRPREPADRRITLTADQQTRILWLSLVLVPGIILATGVYTWWNRRR